LKQHASPKKEIMSYNGIGLPTPRGTGTSGYVQRNASALTPAAQARRGAYGRRQEEDARTREREARFHRTNYVERKVDAGVLAHERRRAIEVECMALRDELEDQPSISEAEIEQRVDDLRSLLKARAEDERDNDRRPGGTSNGISSSGGSISNNNNGPRQTQYKAHQVHEIVRAKEIENERFRTEVLQQQQQQSGWRQRDDFHRNRERGGGPDQRRRRSSAGSYDRDRSLSPPRESAAANDEIRARRERSPSRELRHHHHHHRRRRDSFDDHTPRRSRRASLLSRSRSPPLYEEDGEEAGGTGGTTSSRNRRSSVASPDHERRRRSSVVSREHGSASPEVTHRRSRSPTRREFRRRGSRYSDVELNYS
jgi:serine/arginine repetitive matrix protein 2